MSKKIRFKKDVFDYTGTVKRFSEGDKFDVLQELDDGYHFGMGLMHSMAKSTEDSDYSDLYEIIDDENKSVNNETDEMVNEEKPKNKSKKEKTQDIEVEKETDIDIGDNIDVVDTNNTVNIDTDKESEVTSETTGVPEVVVNLETPENTTVTVTE